MKKLIIGLLALLPLGSFAYDDTWKDTTFDKVITSYEYSQSLGKSLYLMFKCKETKNPHWCYVLTNHTAWHETKRQTVSTHNTFGMLRYKGLTFEQEVAKFINSFNKYWYNSNCYDMVYKSKYTTTQKQAWITNCVWMSRKFK